MNRNLATVLAVVVVLALAGGAYFLTKSSNDKNSTTSTTQSSSMNTMKSSTSSANEQTQTTPTSTDTVTIKDFAFSPANITVKKGTKVTWTNKDSASHTVTKDTGETSGPDSDNLATGQSYSFTFDTVGTFKYHCAIHSSMTGTVTVTD